MAWRRGVVGRIEPCHSVGDAVVFCRSDRGHERFIVSPILVVVCSDFNTSNVSTMKDEALAEESTIPLLILQC